MRITSRLFEPNLLRMLTYLSRRQAWLSPPEIAAQFRVGGRSVSVRTIHRWFSLLRREGRLSYYPLPRSSVLGLEDVSVKVHGLRSQAVMGIIPYSSGFTVETDLADGHPILTLDFRIPPDGMRHFREFWVTGVDLGLFDRAELCPWRSAHSFFSPYQDTIAPDGTVEAAGQLDNNYFAALARRHLARPAPVRLSERLAASPLIIPNVLEHLFGCYSSRQVWQAIRSKKEAYILRDGRKVRLISGIGKGASLRVIQQQWRDLTHYFEETFVQPIVGLDISKMRNVAVHYFELSTGEPSRAIEAALRASRWSLSTNMRVDWGGEGWTRIRCVHPAENVTPILKILRESRKSGEPLRVSMYDGEAADRLCDNIVCKTDWGLFDSARLEWRFDGDGYVERLKEVTAPDESWVSAYFSGAQPLRAVSPAA